MKLPLILGNWKMNTTRAEAAALATEVAALARKTAGRCTVGVAPPACWLTEVSSALEGSGATLWAQQVHSATSGAFTGEHAATMVGECGARGALVGHSERRQVFGETDEETADRVRALRAAGLDVVLCVGETLEQREAGRTWTRILCQLTAGCADLAHAEGLIVAYEPVWAIGTGRTATPEQAAEVHARIGAWLAERFGEAGASVPVLYGGSVKPSNAAELLRQPRIDGVLVGGASLDAASFAAIALAE